MDTGDSRSKIAALKTLLQRTYALIDYARSKRDTAPIALAGHNHPGHVHNDQRFCDDKERLINDIKHLVDTGWDTLEFPHFKSRLERITPSIASGNVPVWNGFARCRCWWDAKDELQEIADYLQGLKLSLEKTSDQGVSTETPSDKYFTSKRNPWHSGSFYLALLIVVVCLLLIGFQIAGIIGLSIVIIGTLLLVSIVGAFQLRQDKALSQKNFLSLMLMVFRQIPLLLKQNKCDGANEHKQN